MSAVRTKNRLAMLSNERRRQIRGLLWLAAGVVVFGVVRAGWHRMFGVGWWRLW